MIGMRRIIKRVTNDEMISGKPKEIWNKSKKYQTEEGIEENAPFKDDEVGRSDNKIATNSVVTK